MKWYVVVTLLALFFTFGYFANRGLTGGVVQELNEYSWTKALCNLDNECIDVVIYCKDGNAVRIEPLLYGVQHPANWSDPRGNFSDVLCP